MKLIVNAFLAIALTAASAAAQTLSKTEQKMRDWIQAH